MQEVAKRSYVGLTEEPMDVRRIAASTPRAIPRKPSFLHIVLSASHEFL